MMAVALTKEVPRALPANDNGPDRNVDRWRLLIDGMRPIDTALTISLMQCKLRGRDFDEVCAEVLWGLGRGPRPAHRGGPC